VPATLLVAITAAAMPPLFSSTACGGDVAALSSLRYIAGAQEQFRTGVRLDVDGDGEAEYGSFVELSGASVLRGTDRAIPRALLSGAFRTLSTRGTVSRSGYSFQMHLRRPDGTWYAADRAGGEPPPAEAATAFVCYAWPLRAGVTGARTMAIDQSGTVVATDATRYTGPWGPLADAAPGAGCGLTAGCGPDCNTWDVVWTRR